MPARRKKISSGKKISVMAEPAPMEEQPVEEKRPSVTQVVEVVEEEENPQSTDTAVSAEEISEVPEAHQEVQEDIPAVPQESDTQTRKTVVEELYTQKKESAVMPEISMHKQDTKKSLIVWAIVTIIVAILTGSILFAVAKKGSPVSSLFARPTPTPTPAPTPTPTPTPAPVDKASIKIQILNGGGTPGAASKMKTLLEDKGYTVDSTGNAEEYTYTNTEIHGKAAMSDAVSALKSDLKDAYTLGAVAADLDASASADVQVVVGKE